MQPYFETRFLGSLLVRSSAYASAWELVQEYFQPPFWITTFQSLRIEHMLLHQRDATLKAAALQGFQEWQRHIQEGVFQLANLEWEAAYRLALDLNRRALEHAVGPLHYLEGACASLLQATHFVSLDPKARAAAAMLGLGLLPKKSPNR